MQGPGSSIHAAFQRIDENGRGRVESTVSQVIEKMVGDTGIEPVASSV
jgi:hypothetical protein